MGGPPTPSIPKVLHELPLLVEIIIKFEKVMNIYVPFSYICLTAILTDAQMDNHVYQ